LFSRSESAKWATGATASSPTTSRPTCATTDAPFWIALAAAQHETGHLLDDVRDRALTAIDAGHDLEEWDGNARRAATLQRLAARLRGPRSAPKRVRRPRPIDPGAEVGDVIHIVDHESGREALVAVISEEPGWPNGRGRWPIVEYGDVLDEEVGRVVARGIRRSPGRTSSTTHCLWPSLVSMLRWPDYDVSMRLTRRSARQARDQQVAALTEELIWLLEQSQRISREGWRYNRVIVHDRLSSLRTLDPVRVAEFAPQVAALERQHGG
jgi:hypothetical protein